MSENLLQTLQQLVQDVIAPDVRELKVRVSSLEKQMDDRFNSLEQKMDVQFHSLDQKMDAQFNSLEQKMDAQFRVLVAAIGESKAQSELTTIRMVAALSERVAVLEAQQH
jgi:DNA-binding TFAR19-related protein (PDSD5 family)